MRIFALIALLSTLVLAGCGKQPVRYAPPPVESGGRIGISVSQLEVREVSLPSYARTEEIWTENADGGLQSESSVLWSDDPARGITEDLSRHLGAISGVRVAAEPWPFEDLPQARLNVRVHEMVAGKDSRFRMSGQYFVASMTGGRDRTGSFNLSAAIAPDSGPRGVAAARAVVVRDLARLIASRGI